MGEPEPAPPRRRRRIGWGLLAVVLAAVAAGAVFWQTGLPQDRAVQVAAERIAGARVEAAGVRVYPQLGAERLALYDPDDAGAPPALTVSGLAIDYRLRPENNRYIDAVRIDSARAAFVRESTGEHNCDFLVQRFAGPGDGGGPLPFLPQSVAVDRAALSATGPGWFLSLDGVALDLTLDALADFALTAQAERLEAAWRLYDLGMGEQQTTGSAIVELERTAEEGIAATAKIDMRPLADLDVSVSAPALDLAQPAAVEVRYARFRHPLWGAMARDLAPVPVQFEALDITDSRLEAALKNGAPAVPSLVGNAVLAGSVVGPPETPWYQGRLAVRAEGGIAEAAALKGSLEFNEGQQLHARIEGGFASGKAELETGDWSRAQAVALLPAAYRDYAAYWPALSGLRATATAAYEPGSLRANTTVRASTEGAETPLALVGHLETAADGTTGGVVVKNGDGSEVLRVEVNQSTETLWKSEAALAGLDPAWLAGRMRVANPLAALQATLDGAVKADIEAGQPVPFSTSLTGTFARYDDIQPETPLPLALDGSGRITTGGVLEAAKASGNLGALWTFEAGSAALTLAPLSGKGNLAGTLDLGKALPLLGMGGLYGAVDYETPWRIGAGVWRSDGFELASSDFGYGDLAVPYGSALNASGNVRFEPATGNAVCEPLSLRLGDGTQAHADVLEAAPGEGGSYQVSARTVRAQSDFGPAVAKGYLESADATLRLTAENVAYRGGIFEGKGTLTVEGAALTLPGGAAVLNEPGATLDWTAAADGATGSGSFTLARVDTAGTALTELAGKLQLTGGRIEAHEMTGNIFDGRVSGTAGLEPLAENLPARVDLACENLDLEAFTREVEPPNIALTGRVNGRVMVAFDAAGLNDLAIKLKSTEDFSLNRGAVEQILLSQQVGGFTGGKQISKVVQNIIGEEAQRPFRRATLDLGLEGGRITGVAALESEALNLTVDIQADPRALLEALDVGVTAAQ